VEPLLSIALTLSFQGLAPAVQVSRQEGVAYLYDREFVHCMLFQINAPSG